MEVRSDLMRGRVGYTGRCIMNPQHGSEVTGMSSAKLTAMLRQSLSLQLIRSQMCEGKGILGDDLAGHLLVEVESNVIAFSHSFMRHLSNHTSHFRVHPCRMLEAPHIRSMPLF